MLGLIVAQESIVGLLNIGRDRELGRLGLKRPESGSENGDREVNCRRVERVEDVRGDRKETRLEQRI